MLHSTANAASTEALADASQINDFTTGLARGAMTYADNLAQANHDETVGLAQAD